MNDVTKLAFLDELEKIGFVDPEMAESLFKESMSLKPLVNMGKKLIPRAGKQIAKKAPQTAEQLQAGIMKQRAMRMAAGRSGQATMKHIPTALGRQAPTGTRVGAGAFL